MQLAILKGFFCREHSANVLVFLWGITQRFKATNCEWQSVFSYWYFYCMLNPWQLKFLKIIRSRLSSSEVKMTESHVPMWHPYFLCTYYSGKHLLDSFKLIPQRYMWIPSWKKKSRQYFNRLAKRFSDLVPTIQQQPTKMLTFAICLGTRCKRGTTNSYNITLSLPWTEKSQLAVFQFTEGEQQFHGSLQLWQYIYLHKRSTAWGGISFLLKLGCYFIWLCYRDNAQWKHRSLHSYS